MATTDHIIQVKQLVKKYNNRIIVDHLDMNIRKGEVYGFLGPNGSGKTTTIRMLCGLVIPDSGYGHCLNFDILKQSHEIKQHIGYMPQNFSYYKELSVQENLQFVARLHQINEPRQRIRALTEKLGLTPYLNQKSGELSGGWKQLLAFAGAMLHEPKVLLLDEPTAGLDVHARSQFWNHLYSLTQKGLTVLVSTHYMDEAIRCTNLAYLLHGKLTEIGSAKALLDRITLYSWRISCILDEKTLEKLEKEPFISSINTFSGATILTGPDKHRLATYIQKLEKETQDITCQPIEVSTEDTFLYFIKKLKTPEQVKS